MTRRERLLAKHDELTAKAKAIMVAKNHDYTSNSDDPYANFRGSEFVGVHPIIGILMRTMDKIKRVQSYVEQGKLAVAGESLEDALIDVINYAVIIGGYVADKEEQGSLLAPAVDVSGLGGGSKPPPRNLIPREPPTRGGKCVDCGAPTTIEQGDVCNECWAKYKKGAWRRKAPITAIRDGEIEENPRRYLTHTDLEDPSAWSEPDGTGTP